VRRIPSDSIQRTRLLSCQREYSWIGCPRGTEGRLPDRCGLGGCGGTPCSCVWVTAPAAVSASGSLSVASNALRYATRVFSSACSRLWNPRLTRCGGSASRDAPAALAVGDLDPGHSVKSGTSRHRTRSLRRIAPAVQDGALRSRSNSQTIQIAASGGDRSARARREHRSRRHSVLECPGLDRRGLSLRIHSIERSPEAASFRRSSISADPCRGMRKTRRA
jgi:hypothetical protein